MDKDKILKKVQAEKNDECRAANTKTKKEEIGKSPSRIPCG
jgi:hypothetical protein